MYLSNHPVDSKVCIKAAMPRSVFAAASVPCQLCRLGSQLPSHAATDVIDFWLIPMALKRKPILGVPTLLALFYIVLCSASCEGKWEICPLEPTLA